MGTLALGPTFSPTSLLAPSDQTIGFFVGVGRPKKNIGIQSYSPVARLFGPSIFEASKLKVLFLGVDAKKHPGHLPRTYTLTHSDITAKLTLAISQSINNSQLQGWSNKLYRDEVVAEWKKIKGNMSLHVHCHISGGHFLLDLCARLRYFIFFKELPVVLKAFVHGDENLLRNYPELQEASVWVYFHSNIPEYNRAECWGPLRDASPPSSYKDSASSAAVEGEKPASMSVSVPVPEACKVACNCCFPTVSEIQWSRGFDLYDENNASGASLRHEANPRT